MSGIRFTTRPSRFGKVALLWSAHGGEPKVIGVVIPRPEADTNKLVKNASRGSCREMDEVADRIEAFLGGADVRFPLDIARLDLCAPFQRRVLVAEHAIPRGRVSSYGLIARRIGCPKGARAVGRALATNPLPVIVPCHRAVRSDGALGGFQGGLDMKRALLEMEGIEFRDATHVATGRFYYGE
jgi:methylated-DNA-[protein]-cysteine S-methyltransferase